jgi:methyltransferase (TIGR00027 family)
VSRTAEFMALFRALESLRAPEARLFEDRFAAGFLTPTLRCVATASRLPILAALVPRIIDRRWPGPRGAALVRTRFIDDAAVQAIRAGVPQVVILGAGFDSRAYRLPAIESARVFEVDHPVTQGRKRGRLRRMLGTLPSHVVFVAVDFDRDLLGDVMAASGFRPDRPAFFIWEGVTNYLSAEAVDATFRWLSGAAAGSRVLFTYVHRGILDGSARFEGARESMDTVRRVGEPFTFGFDPAELPAYLLARGLRLVEDVGAAEYRARYLAPLGRASLKVSAFYRAAVAEV